MIANGVATATLCPLEESTYDSDLRDGKLSGLTPSEAEAAKFASTQADKGLHWIVATYPK